MRATFLITTLLVGKVTFGQPATRPKALVYRGPAACDGCPEAVAALLKSSPSNFDVKFAGPQEEVDITATSLGGVQLYAQPGGGDLDPAWVGTKKYKNILRDFVARGGRYAGFCLGAFLAGSGPGFELLPLGSDTDEEITQPKAQVTNDSDTVIQVDWHFQTGSRKGHRQNGRWLYFQDGAVMKLARNTSAIVLGTYSSNGDVAASITPLGKGWVGLVGPHPEADESWYNDYNLTNPDGIRFDIGHDFIQSIMAQPEGREEWAKIHSGCDMFPQLSPELVPALYFLITLAVLKSL